MTLHAPILPSKLRRVPDDARKLFRYTDTPTFVRYASEVVRHLPEILQTGTYACADRAMSGTTPRFRTGDPVHPTLVWDGRFFGIAREVCCRRVYFALPGYRIAPEDCVVDLGAHVGSFTVLAALLGRRVLAVEAMPSNIEVLQSLLERNGCSSKVSVEWGMVGERTGWLSEAGARHALTHDAPTLCFREFLDRHEVQQVDFLKIDVEGSEFDLFASAAHWLPRVRRIAMEVHTAFGDPSWLASELRDAGFVVTMLDQDQRPVLHEQEADCYLFAERRPSAPASS
jgi:FkbM family methyltransferase